MDTDNSKEESLEHSSEAVAKTGGGNASEQKTTEDKSDGDESRNKGELTTTDLPVTSEARSEDTHEGIFPGIDKSHGEAKAEDQESRQTPKGDEHGFQLPTTDITTKQDEPRTQATSDDELSPKVTVEGMLPTQTTTDDKLLPPVTVEDSLPSPKESPVDPAGSKQVTETIVTPELQQQENTVTVFAGLAPSFLKLIHPDAEGPSKEGTSQRETVMTAIGMPFLESNDDITLEMFGNTFSGLVMPPCVSLSDQLMMIRDTDMDMFIIPVNKKIGFPSSPTKEATEGGEKSEENLHAFIDDTDSPAGYLKLYSPSPTPDSPYWVQQGEGQTYYLSSTKVLDDIVKRPKIDPVLPQFQEYGVRKVKNVKESAVYKDSESDVDFVVAFSCNQWPASAKTWTTLAHPSSAWPPSYFLTHSCREKCHILPIKKPNSKNTKSSRDLEWQYYFPEAEEVLASHLSLIEQQSYILLKIIYHQELKSLNILTAAHLKAILFWHCEETCEADREAASLLMYLQNILARVFQYVEAKNLPDYFIPSKNHLEGVADDAMTALQGKLQDIILEPMSPIFDFLSLQLPAFWQVDSKVSQVMAILRHTPMNETFYRQMAEVTLHISSKLLTSYLQEERFPEALEVCNIQAESRAALGQHISGKSLFTSLVFQTGKKQLIIRAYDYILQEYQDADDIHSTLGNQACMYHGMMYEVDSEQEKAKMQTNCDEKFQMALMFPNAAGATMVDYATFLVDVGRVADAYEQLCNAIAMERENPSSGNSYDEMEKQGLDVYLKREVENSKDGLSVSSLEYAHYLLVVCCMQIEDYKQETSQHIENLDQILSEMAGKRQIVSGYSLLGYCYWRVDDYKNAEKAFERAGALDPGYTLAHENQRLCSIFQIALLKPADLD